MAHRNRRQRHGRIFYWAAGLLLLALFGILGYRIWSQRDQHTQDDKEVEQAKNALFLPVGSLKGQAPRFVDFLFVRKASDPRWEEVTRSLDAYFPGGADKLASGWPQPGDWPQWRGIRRDGIVDDPKIATTWPADGPPVKWTASVGAGYSSMAVADGRLYTIMQEGGNEVVLCLDAQTGERKWRFDYPALYNSDQGAGPRSTPTVDEQFVYAVGGTGMLHCLDRKSGKKQWDCDLLATFNAPNLQWGVSFSPLVEGDLLLTNPGGPNGNSIVAFNKKTGAVVWKKLDDAAGYSSPVVCTAFGIRQVLCFTGDALVSLNPQNGEVSWRFPWETAYKCNIATPIVLVNTQEKDETKRDAYVFISTAYGKGCALLRVIKDGAGLGVKQVYKNNRMKNHFSSSVFHQDHVYGFDDAYLTCLTFKTGKKLWRELKFNKGTLLAAGDHLIVLGEHGQLALGEPSPEGYREKASFQLTQKKCWPAPALAQGLLYVRDETQIYCLDLRAKKPAGWFAAW